MGAVHPSSDEVAWLRNRFGLQDVPVGSESTR
jgi:hypothetical protein